MNEIFRYFEVQAVTAIDELREGREIVVLSAYEKAAAAITWLSEDEKTRYVFTKEIGVIEIPFDRDEVYEHFYSIVRAGGLLIPRGVRFERFNNE